MSLKQIFKKVLIPCAAGLAVDNHTYGPNCVKRTEESRPSELPIYSDECSVCRESEKPDTPPNQMEEAVGNIRRELWVWQDNMRGYRHKFVDVYKEGVERVDGPGGAVPAKCSDRNHLEHSLDDKCYPLLPCPDTKPPKTKEVKEFKCYKPSWPIGKKPKKPCVERCKHAQKPPPPPPPKCPQPPPKKDPNCCPCCQQTKPGCGVVLEYLREESHGPQRAGAIAISGLAGYVWGMRHCGLFRRLFSATCGALTMAAICYPNEACEYLETVLQEGKKYFIIAYHFAYGDPDETQIENLSSTQLGRLTLRTLALNRANLKRDCTCKLDPSDPKPCSITLDKKPAREKRFLFI